MPTFVHGKNSRFAISAAATQTAVVDISTSLKELGFPRQIDMAETSAFGNVNKTYIQGLADGSISGSGQWAAGSADDIDTLMSDLVDATAPTNFAYAPGGWVSATTTIITASAAKPVFYGKVWCASYEITGSIGDVVAVSFQFQPSEDILRSTGTLTVTSGSWVES
jgi:hypothetical protein